MVFDILLELYLSPQTLNHTLYVMDKSHHLEMNYYANFLEGLGSNKFQLKTAPMSIEIIKIRLGATS